MIERNWQNWNLAGERFQPICQDVCAITDPDNIAETPVLPPDAGMPLKRSMMFIKLRNLQIGGDSNFALTVESAMGYLPEGDDNATQELYTKSSECAGRIVAGECTKFVKVYDAKEDKTKIITRDHAESLGFTEQ